MGYFKFQAVQNPFGILFHPLAIENLVIRAVEQRMYTAEEVFFENERWHCHDAHSELSDTSKEKLLKKLNSGLELTLEQMTKASHIILTFGTAWVYRKTETNAVVANCHKVPRKAFSKEILSIETIVKSLENSIRFVQSVNEKAQIIFTLSPVRHLKDGFVENQRSKAHLTAAVYQLINSPSEGGSWGKDYFPAYELMMDELRDYRFYKSDMTHPNQLAIDYIWEKFNSVWISESSYDTMDKVEEIQKGVAHRPFNPNSEQHRKFLISLEKKIMYLQQEYGFMRFDEQKEEKS